MGTKLTTKDFIVKAKIVHPGKYDYSQTVYTRSRDKVIIICPKHGAFEQRASAHLDGCGCPRCQKEWSDEHKANHAASARRSRGMTTEAWIARALAVHGDLYDYSQTVYVNQRTDVTIICKKHGAFTQKADSHIRGCGCRLCGLESENHNFDHTWSDEQRQKIADTCLQRYGATRYLDSKEGREKHARIKSDQSFRAKMRKIISSDTVQEKTKQTCIDRYGVPSAMSLPETVDKMHEAKIRNHSWSTSKPEEEMYGLLCTAFGEMAVVRQYKDSRYPFRCDFYIRPLDLFIELNGTWLHGGKWFDASDPECVTVLSNWQKKLAEGHRFYEVAINVWTVRDVKKLNTAKAADLNYLAFWKNDLSDFKNWLETKPLSLNNISNQNECTGHPV